MGQVHDHVRLTVCHDKQFAQLLVALPPVIQQTVLAQEVFCGEGLLGISFDQLHQAPAVL